MSVIACQHLRADREELFDVLLPRLLKLDASLVNRLLVSGNRALHRAAKRAAFRDIIVEFKVPAEGVAAKVPLRNPKLDHLLRDENVGAHVRTIRIQHPSLGRAAQELASRASSTTSDEARKAIWNLTAALVRTCPNLQCFDWQLGIGVGGQLWKALGSSQHLKQLHLLQPDKGLLAVSPSFPRVTPELQPLASAPSVSPRTAYVNSSRGQAIGDANIIGHGGLGLGVGWESLTDLALDGLSQNGSKTVVNLLQMLAQLTGIATLRRLHIGTHFLDANILASIARYGSLGSLRHLTLSTGGTRLTADGLQEVIEGCTNLQSLLLRDFEGRLDKNTWAQLEFWPATFRSLTIEIRESSSHHSWALQHLESIHHVPLGQLTTFAIRRVVHPIALLPFPPTSVALPPNLHDFQHISADLLDSLESSGSKLQHLCLDWWQMSGTELDCIVRACPSLRILQVAVEFPVIKLPLMTTTFAALLNLEQLVITSPPECNIGATSKNHFEFSPDQAKTLPPNLVDRLQEQDPSIPDSRDLRKLVRRLPRFKLLSWTGRGGKGDWRFVKRTTLVSVTFIHSAILTEQIWRECQLQQPIFDFEELPQCGPPILELPAAISTSDFPSLTRSSTISSPHSPKTPKSPTDRFSTPPGRLRQSSATAVEWGMGGLALDLGGIPGKGDSPKGMRRASAPIKAVAQQISICTPSISAPTRGFTTPSIGLKIVDSPTAKPTKRLLLGTGAKGVMTSPVPITLDVSAKSPRGPTAGGDSRSFSGQTGGKDQKSNGNGNGNGNDSVSGLGIVSGKPFGRIAGSETVTGKRNDKTAQEGVKHKVTGREKDKSRISQKGREQEKGIGKEKENQKEREKQKEKEKSKKESKSIYKSFVDGHGVGAGTQGARRNGA